MRLAAIDAPDFLSSPKCRRRPRFAWCDDAAARASRDALAKLAAGRVVRCRMVDADPRTGLFDAADRYGRPVVRCRVNGVDLGEAQLRSGHARRWL